MPAPTVAEVEQWLDRLYIAAEGATLRAEDRRKAVEVAALLVEVERALGRAARGAGALTLVDAAAGKSYVGLLAAQLVLGPRGGPARVVSLERDPRRAALSRAAAGKLTVDVAVECVCGDVGDAALWPAGPALVVALHACGAAADAILDRAVAAGARRLLLVPCCTGAGVPALPAAAAAAEALGVPRHAPVRRRFLQAMVDSERTLRLEAAGYETAVIELVPPTVTPHNLLWRARRVGEPSRARAAAAALARLTGR
ncbi:MAG TPA: methyltransferase [Polyangia bacterium]